MQVYTVTLHPPAGGWLASARHHDRRMLLVEQAVNAVAGASEPTLIVLPAGLFRAGTREARDKLASEMASLSQAAQVALVFGIDVASDAKWAPLARTPEGFAFACDEGRTVLWPARQMRRGRDGRPKERRCVRIAEEEVAVVISSEIFHAPIRLQIAQQSPRLIVSLSHAQITHRWRPVLASWSRIAPTIVAEQGPRSALDLKHGVGPPIVPVGWQHAIAAQTDELTLHSYRPRPQVAVGSTTGGMGD